MNEDSFPQVIGPPPKPIPSEMIAWAFEIGNIAGTMGLPPVPPAEFGLAAASWSEGWQAGADLRKGAGWRSLKTDFNWRER